MHKYCGVWLLVVCMLIVGLAAGAVEWPPKLGSPYPDLELVDQSGKKVKLSSFKGKVLLIEPIGMTCPGCQAFAGGNRVGGFQGVAPQPGLQSIEEYFPTFAGGTKVTDERIVFVQLLLYSMTMKAPTAEDAKKWAAHFKYPGKNRVVLAGGPELIGDASYRMIPGFQLVDKSFVLRSDSTGHHPKDNLYEVLLPMVPKVLK